MNQSLQSLFKSRDLNNAYESYTPNQEWVNPLIPLGSWTSTPSIKTFAFKIYAVFFR